MYIPKCHSPATKGHGITATIFQAYNLKHVPAYTSPINITTLTDEEGEKSNSRRNGFTKYCPGTCRVIGCQTQK